MDNFYDNSDHVEAAQPAAAARVPTSEEQVAAILYGKPEQVQVDVPAEVLEARQRRGEGFLSVVDDDLVQHFANPQLGLSPAQQRAAAEEATATRRDIGLSPAEGRELLKIAADLAANPPSLAEQEAMKQDAYAQLVGEYGAMSAVAAQQAAQDLAQSDPRLRAAFDGPLGNHPKVVSKLARAGMARKARKAMAERNK